MPADRAQRPAVGEADRYARLGGVSSVAAALRPGANGHRVAAPQPVPGRARLGAVRIERAERPPASDAQRDQRSGCRDGSPAAGQHEAA